MNDDFNMERRLMLAFLLSAVLMILLLRPWSNPKTAPQAKPAAKPAVAASAGPLASAPAKAKAAVKPAQAAAAPIAASHAERVTVNTPVYRLEFSNRGASARSWILSRYTDQYWHPLDLVDAKFSQRHGYPFEFWSADAGLRKQLAQALYQVKLSQLSGGRQQLTFRWAGNGWSAVKRFEFGRGYEFQVSTELTHNGQAQPHGLAWPGAFASSSAENDFVTERIFARQPGKLLKWEPKNIAGISSPLREGYEYAGLENKYFALAFLPNNTPEIELTRMKTSYHPLVMSHGREIAGKPAETLGVAIGGSPQWRVFIGPKRLALLGRVAPHLSELVHFGWFGFAAKPLFLWMRWTYEHIVHNYGWVILIVTFVITMIMYPFRLKAQKTQVKMIALQPRIKSINDRMKKLPLKDPRRMQLQQEMMKLYQEEGINPLGGCLPMLIPLPLIYAFYEVLETSIELRHAPWLFYYHDLSARDPYLIMPILLVATQFWFMALVPMAAGQDQMQARLMKWIMPLGMGYIFFFLPTGVNLYYLGSTLIMVSQQYVINRHYAPLKGAAPAAAAAAGKPRAGTPAPAARKPRGKR